MDLFQWILTNREWLFSGLLVTLPIALLGWLFAWLFRRRRPHWSQTQKAGNNSVNIQVGGNFQVGEEANDARPDPESR